MRDRAGAYRPIGRPPRRAMAFAHPRLTSFSRSASFSLFPGFPPPCPHVHQLTAHQVRSFHPSGLCEPRGRAARPLPGLTAPRPAYAAATGCTVRRAGRPWANAGPDRRMRQTSAIAARRSSSASTRGRIGRPPSAAKANSSWEDRCLRSERMYSPFLTDTPGLGSGPHGPARRRPSPPAGRRSRSHGALRRPHDAPHRQPDRPRTGRPGPRCKD